MFVGGEMGAPAMMGLLLPEKGDGEVGQGLRVSGSQGEVYRLGIWATDLR